MKQELISLELELKKFLDQGFSEADLEGLKVFLEELTRWSQRFNLVSKQDIGRLLERHLADSLILRPFINPSWKIADVGSGGGFPGLPLAIIFRSTSFLLIEPRKNRAQFLKHIKRNLGLTSVEVVERRVEALEERLKEVDSFLFRAVGEVQNILLQIRPWMKPSVKILILTSEGKFSHKIPGFDIKSHPYHLKKGDWGGIIVEITVSRETDEGDGRNIIAGWDRK